MVKKSRQGSQTRHKEQARQQKQQDKAARWREAKQRRARAKSGMDETMPDTAGRRPGSQSFQRLRIVPAIVNSDEEPPRRQGAWRIGMVVSASEFVNCAASAVIAAGGE
jgi:hypothetical protein